MKQLYPFVMILGLSTFSVSGYATESRAQPECEEGDEQCLQQQKQRKQAAQEEEPECE